MSVVDPSIADVVVHRVCGDPSGDHAGFVWLLQDVQTKAMWRTISVRVWSERRLFPVLVAFTEQDAIDYAREMPSDAPHAIVLMRDYYADIVFGLVRPKSDEEIFAEAASIERRLGFSLLRGMILSDRHLGRDLMTGAAGFATSRISEKRSMRAMCEATLTSFAFWAKLWERFPPKLALAYAGGAGLGGRPAALLLRERGVPFRNLSFTRFGSRFYWAEDEFARSTRFAAHFAATTLDDADLESFHADVGRQVLTSPEAIKALKKGKSLVGLAKRLAMTTARYLYGYARGYAKSRRGYRLGSTLGSIARSWYHEHWLAKHSRPDLRALAGRGMVYHALQVEPELTTTLFGQYTSDQFGLVREIALSLPADMVLVVKEHPWQVGSRDLNFYRRIMALPNVLLIHHQYPSVDLIRRATAVTTASSSVSFEAAVLGVPTFHSMSGSVLDVVDHAVAMAGHRDPDLIARISDGESDRAKRRHDGAQLYKALASFGFSFGPEGLVKRSTPLSDTEWADMSRDLDASLLRLDAPARRVDA